MRWSILLGGLLALGLSVGPRAQTGSAASQFVWDQRDAPLTTVQGATYRIYEDGVGTILAGVTCAGAQAPFTCAAPLPAFAPGEHTVVLTADDGVTETAPSNPITFTFVTGPPTAPQDVTLLGFSRRPRRR